MSWPSIVDSLADRLDVRPSDAQPLGRADQTVEVAGESERLVAHDLDALEHTVAHDHAVVERADGQFVRGLQKVSVDPGPHALTLRDPGLGLREDVG
jgi:hypothetical protein